METSALIPLSALAGLLIYVAFAGIGGLVARKRKVINASSLREEPSIAENIHDIGPTRVFVPNVLARWPWPRRINPNYPMLKKEADAWVASFQPFNPKAQDTYDRCDFNLLACLAYPNASKEHARAGCDLMHLFFLFDEYSDRSTPSEVRQQKDAIMDALRNPHTPRPKGEWFGGEFTRQFWELAVQNATAVSEKRFIEAMDEYLEGVVRESIDKKERVLDVERTPPFRR